MLWTHPGRAHTAPNTKRTGNVNSVAARHGTVHSDTVCQGAVHPDTARHSTVRLDTVGTASAYRMERVRAFSFWTQLCQGIFLLDAAVSGQMASGQRVSWHHGHAGC